MLTIFLRFSWTIETCDKTKNRDERLLNFLLRSISKTKNVGRIGTFAGDGVGLADAPYDFLERASKQGHLLFVFTWLVLRVESRRECERLGVRVVVRTVSSFWDCVCARDLDQRIITSHSRLTSFIPRGGEPM